jgi:hypothetical protein
MHSPLQSEPWYNVTLGSLSVGYGVVDTVARLPSGSPFRKAGDAAFPFAFFAFLAQIYVTFAVTLRFLGRNDGCSGRIPHSLRVRGGCALCACACGRAGPCVWLVVLYTLVLCVAVLCVSRSAYLLLSAHAHNQCMLATIRCLLCLLSLTHPHAHPQLTPNAAISLTIRVRPFLFGPVSVSCIVVRNPRPVSSPVSCPASAASCPLSSTRACTTPTSWTARAASGVASA